MKRYHRSTRPGALSAPRASRRALLLPALLLATFVLLAGLAPAPLRAATGEALNFDGSDDYVDLGTNIPGQLTNGTFTLEAWVYLNNYTDWGTFVKNWGDYSGGAFHWGLNDVSHQQSLYVTQSDGNAPFVVSPNDLPLNTWIHVAAVADGVKLKLYENGAEVASADYDGTLLTSSDDPPFPPTFLGAKPGNYGGTAEDGYVGFLAGTLDEVRIWNTARTAAEIQQSRSSELTGTPTGLIAYYQFNQGVAGGDNTAITTLTDSSGGSNNGSLQKFTLDGNSSNFIAPGFPPSINNAPVASDGTLTAITGQATASNLPTATDADTSDTVTYAKVSDPAHGTVTVNADGTYSYKSNVGYTGADSFTYKATDNHGADSNTATINITVNDAAQTTPDFVVNSTADPGDGACTIVNCTLREAVAAANGNADTSIITFDATVFATAQTIQLNGTQLLITQNLTLTGPSVGVTLDGNNASRVLQVVSGTTTATNLSVTKGRTSDGGGIWVDGGARFNLTGGTLSNNTATGNGGLGGALLSGGIVTLTNVTFSGNHSGNLTTNAAGGGGAIYTNTGGTLNVVNCSFTNNTTDGSGGALFSDNNFTAVGSTFSNNTAAVNGGAIVNKGNPGKVINCTLRANSAVQGGAIFLSQPATVIGSTFSDNDASGNGDSINCQATLTIGNTILATNTTLQATGQNLFGAGGSVASQGYNLCTDGGGGFLTATGDKINTDPKLDTNGLQPNGGPTQTIKLLLGSAAIDAGKNLALDSNNKAITTDQRGLTRPKDQANYANATNGDGSDIGAYEEQSNLPAPPQSGPNLVVNSSADPGDGTCDVTGTGDGCTLREAINVANTYNSANGNAGATITFDATAFAAAQTINLTGALPELDSKITITGPGADKVNLHRSTGGEYRLFKVNSGKTVSISGLTLSNGSVHGAAFIDQIGGGIVNDHGTLTVTGCTFSGNSANYGGGLYNFVGAGTTTVNTCTFNTNTATNGGGGVYNDQSTVNVSNSTFDTNTVTTFNFYSGGGLYNHEGNSTITGSTFVNNSAPNGGGGLYNQGAYGGANMTVFNSTLSGNSSTGGGGIFNDGRASDTLTKGNGNLIVRNCTLSGNSSTSNGAGGIQSDATSQGSGVGKATLTISNTILSNGTGGNYVGVGGAGATVTSEGYNLSSDGTGPNNGTADKLNTDPKLDTNGLQPNGGPTKTIKLLAGSPAINKGKDLSGLGKDQRGENRPIGTAAATGGDGSDIGAFEAQFADLPLTVSFTTANTTPTGTTPAKSSTITSTTLPVITGQASELAKNVVRVDLFLWRNKVGGGIEYWTGSQWTSNVAGMTTTLSPAGGGASVSWSRNAGLSGSSFQDGVYYLRARAVDQSNSFTLVNSSFTKITDSNPPTVSFTTATTTPVGTTPDNGDTVTASTLPVITGKAADSGSGIKRVDLYVVRDKSGGGYEYWNGGGWVNTVTALSTTLSPSSGGASVSWSCNAGLSGSSDFTNGTYYVKAWAYDKSSNGSWVKNTFTRSSGSNSVAQVPAAQASVEGSAVSSSSSISLTFQGTVPASFSVSVNGAGVKVQSMDRAAQSVTLLLSEGSLTAGDQVVVSWKGGQTTLTVQ